MNQLVSLYERTTQKLSRIDALGPLLARLSLGAMFLSTGWGKLHNLEGVTGFFEELGIVFPAFNAHLVATTEFAGGIALIAGLGTRLASIPLAITMTVAILTARLGDVDGALSFLGLEEFTYFAVLLWLALVGGGSWSLDAIIKRRLLDDHDAHESSGPTKLATES